jgi:hypothetical protein
MKRHGTFYHKILKGKLGVMEVFWSWDVNDFGEGRFCVVWDEFRIGYKVSFWRVFECRVDW